VLAPRFIWRRLPRGRWQHDDTRARTEKPSPRIYCISVRRTLPVIFLPSALTTQPLSDEESYGNVSARWEDFARVDMAIFNSTAHRCPRPQHVGRPLLPDAPGSARTPFLDGACTPERTPERRPLRENPRPQTTFALARSLPLR
jgi:hypothetical protein